MVKRENLVFWLEGQGRVYCHTAKLEPSWRATFDQVSLSLMAVQLNIRTVKIVSTEDCDVCAEWHLFVTSHRKGPADGMGWKVKRQVYRDCTVIK
jgi:hypothetical protein